MNLLFKVVALITLALFFTNSYAEVTTKVICTYAPSQSKLVNSLGSLGGGAAASTEITLFANGLSILPHSSGGTILAGSGGYIAGTMTGSVVASALVTVGIVVGGSAVVLELVCVPTNHPELVKNLQNDSAEYSDTANDFLRSASLQVKPISKSITQELADLFKHYKTLSKDKFYEVIGETWYQRAMRKTKEAFAN